MAPWKLNRECLKWAGSCIIDIGKGRRSKRGLPVVHVSHTMLWKKMKAIVRVCGTGQSDWFHQQKTQQYLKTALKNTERIQTLTGFEGQVTVNIVLTSVVVNFCLLEITWRRSDVLLILLRWCYTRRFATTIFSATQRWNIVATLFWIVTTLFQRCNAVLR